MGEYGWRRQYPMEKWCRVATMRCSHRPRTSRKMIKELTRGIANFTFDFLKISDRRLKDVNLMYEDTQPWRSIWKLKARRELGENGVGGVWNGGLFFIFFLWYEIGLRSFITPNPVARHAPSYEWGARLSQLVLFKWATSRCASSLQARVHALL